MAVKRIQLRRDCRKEWTTYNPVLADGEVVLISETKGEEYTSFKIGNGVLTWQELKEHAISNLPLNTMDIVLDDTRVLTGTTRIIKFKPK